jgi:hypothetical protein
VAIVSGIAAIPMSGIISDIAESNFFMATDRTCAGRELAVLSLCGPSAFFVAAIPVAESTQQIPRIHLVLRVNHAAAKRSSVK